MEQKRVGVIGLGVISGVHLEALRQLDNCRLAAGCDVKPEKQEVLKPGEAFYTDYTRMIQEERLDAVHICLPHYLHKPVAEDCCAAGVHVLCEKPMAVTEEELVSMEGLEERFGVKVGICFQNRYNATFRRLLELVQKKTYGKLKAVKGIVTWNRGEEYYREAPWRGIFAESGGGCMINQSIHTLDLMQLLGGPIEAINGTVSRWMDYDTEVEDTAGARIRFANGAAGIFFSTVGYGENSSVELEAVCENAVLNIKESMLTVKENGKDIAVLCRDSVPGEKSYYGCGHPGLIGEFYRMLEDGSGSYVSCREGAVSVRMIHRIYESSLMHREVLWKNGAREGRS